MNDLFDEDNKGYESDQAPSNFLKEKFSIKDFLKHSETKSILDQQHIWTFTEKCEKACIEYYLNEAKASDNAGASIFACDRGGHHAGMLAGIVFNAIEPKYDLTIFYDYPYLAQPLVDNYELIKEEEEKERLRKQREIYLATKNVGKKFDWATKTYK